MTDDLENSKSLTASEKAEGLKTVESFKKFLPNELITELRGVFSDKRYEGGKRDGKLVEVYELSKKLKQELKGQGGLLVTELVRKSRKEFKKELIKKIYPTILLKEPGPKSPEEKAALVKTLNSDISDVIKKRSIKDPEQKPYLKIINEAIEEKRKEIENKLKGSLTYKDQDQDKDQDKDKNQDKDQDKNKDQPEAEQSGGIRQDKTQEIEDYVFRWFGLGPINTNDIYSTIANTQLPAAIGQAIKYYYYRKQSKLNQADDTDEKPQESIPRGPSITIPKPL